MNLLRTYWILARLAPPWGALDALGHLLNIPKRWQDPLCDKLDAAVMEPLLRDIEWSG